MKVDRRTALGRGPSDIEWELGRLDAAPVAPGLRGRILGRAREVRAAAALTPRMRILALACAALIVAALAVDPLVGRLEAARLEGLLGVPGVPEPKGPGSDPLWAELGLDAGGIDKALGGGIVKLRSKGREASLRDYRRAMDRMKGTIDHEDPESII